MIASGASSPRRLKVGALRDTVLEAEVVTGDGRLVRSGARTVKNVTGYDLHKLVAGSLGTLAVIVQVALKLRPLPRARRTLRFDGDLALARRARGRGARIGRGARDAGRRRRPPRRLARGGRGADRDGSPGAATGRHGRRCAVPDRAALGRTTGRRGSGRPPFAARRGDRRRRLGRARRRRDRVGGSGRWEERARRAPEPRPRGRRDRTDRSRSRRPGRLAGGGSGRASSPEGGVRSERGARPRPGWEGPPSD